MHRDIKLSNLGITNLVEKEVRGEVEVVILDYGQCICAESCKARKGSIWTVPYLAPEMEVEGGVYGQAVDVWACAIVGLQLFVTEGKTEWRYVI